MTPSLHSYTLVPKHLSCYFHDRANQYSLLNDSCPRLYCRLYEMQRGTPKDVCPEGAFTLPGEARQA